MTVTPISIVAGPFVADGVNRIWDFNFSVDEKAHLYVVFEDLASNLTVVPLADFDAGNSWPIPENSGHVTYPIAPTAALPAGYTVTIERRTTYEQRTKMPSQGRFFPLAVEQAMDYLARQIQQLNYRINNITAAIVVADQDYGDITVSAGGQQWTIDNNAITKAKMADIATDRLLGRDTAATGDPEEITVGGGLEFTGTGGVQRSALTGDVAAPAGDNTTTIQANAVTTGKIIDKAVTFAKLQDINTDKLIGRDAAGVGVPGEISIDVSLEFTGGNVLRRTAISGDVVVPAGSNAAVIQPDSVSFAKMQNITGDRLLGRNDLAVGDVEEITLTGGVEFDGTNGLRRSAITGDVSVPAGSNTASIPNDTVTFPKMQNIGTDRLIGRDTAASGDPEEIAVGGGLEFTGAGGIQRSALTGDVTAPLGGTVTTIANDAVTNAKAANMAAATIKGRAVGAGTGDPTDLTAAQATAILNAFVGSGASNAKGLVPAPGAVAGTAKVLKENASWAALTAVEVVNTPAAPLVSTDVQAAIDELASLIVASAGTVAVPADRTTLKAVDTTSLTVAVLKEADREGLFVWKTGDFTTHHALDTDEGVYVKANAVASASGSWVRVGIVGVLMGAWFGIAGTSKATDYGPAINRAMQVAQLTKSYELHLREGDYGVATEILPVEGVVLSGVGQGVLPSTTTIDDADYQAQPKTLLYAMASIPAGSAVIRLQPLAGAKYALNNTGLQRIAIDCDAHCPYGIRVLTVQNSQFRDLLVARATSVNIDEDTLVATVTGTATAGAANTITLPAASRSSRDSVYNGLTISITAGTGAGQSRTISAYVGSTGVATVSVNWGTNPDATSVYSIAGNGVTEGNNATLDNAWKNVISWCSDASATVGWRQTGTTINNVNRCLYDNIQIIHANGEGLRCAQCDTNAWTNLSTYSKGTGSGVRLLGNSVNAFEFCRSITFLNCQPSDGLGAGTGGLRVESGTVVSPKDIYFHVNPENSVPDPVIQSGCEVAYVSHVSGGFISPGWKLVAYDYVAGTAVTATTAETLFTPDIIIKGGTLGRNGKVKVKYGVSVTLSNANAKTFRVKFGNGTIGGSNNLRSEALANNLYCEGEVEFRNRNAANAQVIGILAGGTTGGWGLSNVATPTLARDTANDQHIDFTAQLGVGTDSMRIEWYEVYVWQNTK